MSIVHDNNNRSGLRFTAALLILAASLFLLTLSGCKSHKAIEVNTRYDGNQTTVVKPENAKGKLIEEAYTWIGTPYKYAAAEKGIGADCSGFVMKVFYDALECALPRNSAKQAEFCAPVNDESVEAGDLVFFATGKTSGKVSHVGIMVDSHQFIHASSSKGVVVSDLTKPYYQRTFVKFGRVPSVQ